MCLLLNLNNVFNREICTTLIVHCFESKGYIKKILINTDYYMPITKNNSVI